MGLWDKLEEGVRGTYEKGKAWVKRHPAISLAAAGASIVATGGASIPVIVAVGASGAVIGSNIRPELKDEQKKEPPK